MDKKLQLLLMTMRALVSRSRHASPITGKWPPRRRRVAALQYPKPGRRLSACNLPGGADIYGSQCRHVEQDRDAPGIVSLDAVVHGHRLHGDDREPAVWLDAVCQSDRREIRLDQGGDPGRLHDLRSDGDVAR